MATTTAELRVVGWVPRWWRDGVRTPLWWVAAIVAPGLLVASTITAYEHGVPPALARLVGASPGARRRLVPLFGVFIVMDSFKGSTSSSTCSTGSRFSRAGSGTSGTSR